MRENIVPRENVEGVKDAATALINDVERFGRVTRDAAADTIENAQETLKKNAADLYGKSREALHEVEGYVQKHPVRVLLIAAAAGFMLGLLRKNAR